MEMTALAIIVYMVLLALAFKAFASLKERVMRRQYDDGKSVQLPSAACGLTFVQKFSPHVARGSVLTIDAGDGLYPTWHTKSRRDDYLGALENWLRSGAVINIIVTQTLTDSSDNPWPGLKSRNPDRLHIYFLDRSKISGPMAERNKHVIDILDTFHPSVLVNQSPSMKGYPGALWLESNHPSGSIYAYGVEFVAPNDAAKDPRFEGYKRLYEEILSGPNATELYCSTTTVSREQRAA